MKKLSLYICLLALPLLLTATASAQTSFQLVQHLYQEVYNAQDLAVIEDIIAPDFVDHGQPVLSSRDDIATIVTTLHTRLTDFQVTVDRWYIRDRYVVVLATYSGLHGAQQMTWSLVEVYHIEAGQITEAWHHPLNAAVTAPNTSLY